MLRNARTKVLQQLLIFDSLMTVLKEWQIVTSYFVRAQRKQKNINPRLHTYCAVSDMRNCVLCS